MLPLPALLALPALPVAFEPGLGVAGEVSHARAAESAAPRASAKPRLRSGWGEGDECDQPINFQADGTIKDGPFANWTIENGELVMSDPDLGDGPRIKLTVTDKDTMASTREGDDETRTLKRCG